MYWNGHSDGRADKLQRRSQPNDPSSSSRSHYEHYSSGTGTAWSEKEQKSKLAAALQATSSRSISYSQTHETRTESTSKSSWSGTYSRESVPAGCASSPTRQNIVTSTPKGAEAGHGHYTTTPPHSQVLDLKYNDNSYHVIAKLIIGRFEDQFNLHSETITITAGDRYHLDRVVPTKTGFVEAVQYRLRDCPEDSQKSIHLITRQCRALGLHLEGEKNLLFAPVGTVIKIDVSFTENGCFSDEASRSFPLKDSLVFAS
jgi:hypothetical protein